jgi:hypothetical protein
VGFIYHGGPEAEKVTRIARQEIRLESARVPPIPEAFAVVIRSSSQCQNEGQKDDANDDDDLDGGQPEFKFTEKLHAKVVDGNNRYPEDSDEDTGIDSVPVYPKL